MDGSCAERDEAGGRGGGERESGSRADRRGAAAPGGGRRSRRRRQVRARTVAIKQMRKEELRLGGLLYPERDYWRPRSRGECRNMPRPCPFVGCKYHLYVDVSARGGIKFNFPDLEVWDLAETCVLDVAERPGGVTLEEVGAIMNLTRERVRQLEAIGLKRLGEAGLLEPLGERCPALRAAASRRRPLVEADDDADEADELASAAGDDDD